MGQPLTTFRDSREGQLHDAYIIEGKPVDRVRAEQHLLIDSLTFFLWEVIAIPYELIRFPVDVSRTHTLVISYDEKDMVISNYLVPLGKDPKTWTGCEDEAGVDRCPRSSK